MTAAGFTHQDIQDLLGAFALDAVDDDERDLVQAHLAGCPRCRAEVEGHRETAALLAHRGERAPEGVWDRIAGTLDEAPPVLDLTRIVSPPEGSDPSGPAEGPAGGRNGRRLPRAVSLRMVAATMAVAAAVSLLLGVGLGRRGGGDLGRLERAVEALGRAALGNAAFAALRDPANEQVTLTSTDGTPAARVVRLPDGTGYLVPGGLAALPEGRVYQLWAVRSDAKISLGVLGREPEISAFRMTEPVLAYAVTAEAAGGVAAPEGEPVVLGWVGGRPPATG